jgi:polyhydroxyalkanoate synthesis regulator protein
MVGMPGFEAMRKQQEAFMKTMMGGMPGWGVPSPSKDDSAPEPGSAEELAEIKKQFAELQKKLSKL